MKQGRKLKTVFKKKKKKYVSKSFRQPGLEGYQMAVSMERLIMWTIVPGKNLELILRKSVLKITHCALAFVNMIQ